MSICETAQSIAPIETPAKSARPPLTSESPAAPPRGVLRMLCIIAAALAIIMSTAAMQQTRQSLAAANRRAAAVDRDFAAASNQVQSVMDLRQTQQSIAQQAQSAEKMLEATPRSAVLADVTNALPAGSWLASFTLDSADSGGAANVSVIGFAPDDAAVGQYAQNLRQSNLLHDVKISACDRATDQGMNLRRFRIDLSAGGALDPLKPAVPPTLTASIGH